MMTNVKGFVKGMRDDEQCQAACEHVCGLAAEVLGCQ